MAKAGAAQGAQVVELQIPCRPEYVSVVRLAVAGVASRLPFGYDVIEDIKQAVAEACNNAVEYGKPPTLSPDEATVVVRCTVTDSALEIEVMDQGPGFDPEKTEKGLGMTIMESLMDEVEYIRPPGGGMLIRMVKRVGTG
ncbi:MAG TPA: hypothetical protein EYP65_00770 [Armatimonadetes bacterium]|nr:hypothetical protein [Armatimonadota bacterium]